MCISYNESHVCDVALSPTRAKGHVAERRAAAPRSPRRPEGAPMHIRAVMRRCTESISNDTCIWQIWGVRVLIGSLDRGRPQPSLGFRGSA